jgi:hypothetical protein
MRKTQITRAEYLQLLGMKTIGDQHLAALNELLAVACSIVGEEDKWSHMGDCFWTDDQTVAATLKKMEITVLPEPPIPLITKGWEVEPIILDMGKPEERQGYLLVRGEGEGREEIPLDVKAAPIIEALIRAVAPSIPEDNNGKN